MKNNTPKLILSAIVIILGVALVYGTGSDSSIGFPSIEKNNKAITCNVVLQNYLLENVKIQSSQCSSKLAYVCSPVSAQELFLGYTDIGKLRLQAGLASSSKSYSISETKTAEHTLTVCTPKEITEARIVVYDDKNQIMDEKREVV